jgi:hypothetical protein
LIAEFGRQFTQFVLCLGDVVLMAADRIHDHCSLRRAAKIHQ